MHVVVGITGNTGGTVARTLLDRGARVKAVVRDVGRAESWAAKDVELATGDLKDAESLERAFAGAEAAYVLNPPAYTAPDLFAEAEQMARAIRRASEATGLRHLVVLSSVGAHIPTGTGNIHTNWYFEDCLGGLSGHVTFVRPAYFMQNWGAVAAAAARDGVLPSFLGPLDRAIPMVSAADIGRVAAQAMLDGDRAPTVIELAGPRSYSPNDAAAAFGKVLGRAVQAIEVPEAQWPAVLKQTGFTDRTIEAWVEMFGGFNSGAIDFEGVGKLQRGTTTLEQAVAALLEETEAPSLGVQA